MMRHDLKACAAASATLLALGLTGCGDSDGSEPAADPGTVATTATEPTAASGTAGETDAAGPSDPTGTDPTGTDPTGTEPTGTEPTGTDLTEGPDRSAAGSSTDSPADGLQPVGAFGSEAVESDGFPSAAGEVAYLTDVRVADQDGFDRVVFELAGDDVPSYRLGYAQPPITEDGSGQPVEVTGDAFLQLVLTPASGVDLSGTEPREVYDGPSEVSAPGTEVVTEVVETGDFEATLSWVIGMEQEAPFAVSFLEDPLRLVVDVQHP